MMSQGGGAGAPVAAEAEGEGRKLGDHLNSFRHYCCHHRISRISRGHEARAAKNGTSRGRQRTSTPQRQTKAGTAGTFNQPLLPSSSASRRPATVDQLPAVITWHTTTQDNSTRAISSARNPPHAHCSSSVEGAISTVGRAGCSYTKRPEAEAPLFGDAFSLRLGGCRCDAWVEERGCATSTSPGLLTPDQKGFLHRGTHMNTSHFPSLHLRLALYASPSR